VRFYPGYGAFRLVRGCFYCAIAPRPALKPAARLLHAQRLEAIGTLAGGIAHDLNNTLVPIVSLSSLLLKGNAPEGRERECLELVQKSGVVAAIW